MGIMQNKPPIRPFLRTGINHLPIDNRKIAGLCRAKERRNLGFGRNGAIRGSVPAGRDRCGDPAPPRKHRLIRPVTPRIRQTVARALLHQDERIEHHLLPKPVHMRNRLDHRGITRRAPVHRQIVHARHRLGTASCHTTDLPRHPLAIRADLFNLWLQRTFPDPQIIAEPRHDKPHSPAIGGFALQAGHRDDKIRFTVWRIDIDRTVSPQTVREMHRGGCQRIFAGPRHQRHTWQSPRHVAFRSALLRFNRPDHLERQLRHPVAEPRQHQVFQHNIGGPAIGRHAACPLNRLDQRIGHLICPALIHPHRQVLGGDFLAIGPNAANPRDLAFAQGNRQTDRIGVLPLNRPTALAATGFGEMFLETGGPDHMPANPNAPVHFLKRPPFLRPHQPEPVHAAGLNRLAALAEQMFVNSPANRCANGPANRDRRQTKNRTAHRAAKCGSGCG